MTPERRAQAVNTLRTNAAHSGIPNACRDAADELEATATLRADLAKAKERIAELEALIRLETDNARCYLDQGTPGAVAGPMDRLRGAVP